MDRADEAEKPDLAGRGPQAPGFSPDRGCCAGRGGIDTIK